MKYILIIIFNFIVLNSFAQVDVLKYNFDYFTVYNYKKSENNTLGPIRIVNYSNSKDSSYVLSVFLDNNITKEIHLIDYKNLRQYKFDNNNNFVDLKDLSFLKITTNHNYHNILEFCKKKTKIYYEIDYQNQSDGSILIKKYKNKNKKKLLFQFFLEIIPSEITQNQHYNFSPLINPLWCNKFTLNNKEIILKSYAVVNNEKVDINQLEKISKIEFSLTVDLTK